MFCGAMEIAQLIKGFNCLFVIDVYSEHNVTVVIFDDFTFFLFDLHIYVICGQICHTRVKKSRDNITDNAQGFSIVNHHEKFFISSPKSFTHIAKTIYYNFQGFALSYPPPPCSSTMSPAPCPWSSMTPTSQSSLPQTSSTLQIF